MGIWTIGCILILLWTSLIEGVLSNLGMAPELMNGSTNLSIIIIILVVMLAYRFTTYTVYYSLLKNVEFGWRKSKYWFLMPASTRGESGKLDPNKKFKSLSQIDEFIESLSM